MDTTELTKKIETMIPGIETHIMDAALCVDKLKNVKISLASTEALILVDAGASIDGKNAEERDIKRRAYLSTNTRYLICEQEVIKAESALAVSNALVEIDKMYLRCYEMLVKLATS